MGLKPPLKHSVHAHAFVNKQTLTCNEDGLVGGFHPKPGQEIVQKTARLVGNIQQTDQRGCQRTQPQDQVEAQVQKQTATGRNGRERRQVERDRVLHGLIPRMPRTLLRLFEVQSPPLRRR